MSISIIDAAIIVIYLIGITAVGCLCGRHQQKNANDYFLASRSLRWGTIGLALFATNISTVHLIGLASSGFSDGMVIGNFEWLAPFLLILLGLVFAPFYFRNKIATLPEYLEGRYSPASRTFLAFMGVIGALFIHIGVTLYAGAIMLQSFIEIDILWSILIISALTVAYTVSGGLKAVVITESIQTIMLLVGAAAVTVFGVIALRDASIESLTALKEAVEPGQLSMIRPEGEFAWYALLLGYPVLGIWYWCSDQTIVQRVLGAHSEYDAQVGPIFAGFLKILPVLLMVFPGVVAYALFHDLIADNPDKTLIVLIQELLPVGLEGLVIAGLLAALMSTVAGALNSTATLVSIDLVKRLKPDTSDQQLVRIGQITVIIVLVLAIAWSTQGERFGGIFKGINQMIAVLAPPISTVFIWGIFWKRGTATASITTLATGFVLGGIVFVLDFPAVSGLVLGFHENGQAHRLFTESWNIPFMLQAWWLFVICSIVFVLTSLASKAPSRECTEKFCWDNPLTILTGSKIQGISDPRSLSVILILIMLICYYLFA